MKRLILLVFGLFAFPVFASHIVGGEFEIKHISGNLYSVRLIIYFDELNGQPGARDPFADVRIFRMSDDAIMRTLQLTKIGEEPVDYTQPECSEGEIVTTKLIYGAEITMTESEFNHPKGYYLTWQRCCRNYSITNIFSQDPALGPLFAGQTFYLEFPPVIKDGVPFINSSPRLFPPLNDYACTNKPYYVDFAGVDDDGDSLVYTLVAPLNTKTATPLPIPDNLPLSRPFDDVMFRSGYGLKNYVAGNPDLKISEDGFLTVTPTQQGLFVFAIKCEEFRNGERIGEVRRDFQMLVLNTCSVAEPPQIMGKKLNEAAFTYDENMSVTFSNSVSDENRCIQVEVSDLDALRAQDGFTEKIKIRAIPIGFKTKMDGILPSITTATLLNGSTKVFDICFDECPPFESGIFQVGIVAYDDACSLPLSDTLKITVNIEPPANSKPYFTTANIAETVMEGDPRVYPIRAVDDDDDKLVYFALNDQFVFEDVGMTINQTQLTDGLFEGELVWNTQCDIYDFTKKQNFEVKILVEDLDKCNFSKRDTMIFNLAIDLPGNLDPVISTNLTPDEVQNGVIRKIHESLDFTVTGSDGDNDFIILGGDGTDFNFTTYGMSFPQKNGNGLTPLLSNFHWDLNCSAVNLAVKDEFDLRFIVVDNANKCRFYKADTLNVKVFVEPPDNLKPLLQVVNTNLDLAFENNHQTVILGQQISLALLANDQDTSPSQDQISIELIDVVGTPPANGYVFAPVTGLGSANTTFAWKPECFLFENNVWTNEYTFTFRAVDNRCFNSLADTVEVDFTIKDVEHLSLEFLPPNLVTPNGDSKNDFFAMVREDELTKELISILPPDNCVGQFLAISIYNRWGNDIFKSDSRDFKWYPKNEAAGIYFYTLKFSDKEFKGSITVKY